MSPVYTEAGVEGASGPPKNRSGGLGRQRSPSKKTEAGGLSRRRSLETATQTSTLPHSSTPYNS